MNKTPQNRAASFLPLLLTLFLSISVSCVIPPALPGRDHPQHLTVLYLNDLHGQLEPSTANGEKRAGGAARLAALVAKIRAENRRLGRETILLVAGDLFLGSSLSALYRGEAEIDFLNRLRPDAMTLGNHEFDFGMEVLRERIREALFPVVSANTYRGQKRLLPPFVFKDLGGQMRVGILGLITPDTAQLAHPKQIAGITFRDPVAEAKRLAAEIREGSDIFIALTHTGIEIDKRLARDIPALDVIIGGHDHIALSDPLKIGEVWICQAQYRGLFLGRLDLTIDGRKVTKVGGQLIPVTEDLAEDREVKEMVASYRAKLGHKLKEVVGKNRVRLVGEAEKIRRMETNLGNLVADIMRGAAHTDIALVNAGSIRGSIEEGPITLEDIWRVFPYESRLVRVELSGSQIQQVLRHGVSLGPGLAGGFLQISGLSFAIGPAGPQDIRVHGEPLRPERFYSVATTDFLLAGGDGYSHFQKGRNPVVQPFLMRELVLDYLKENKEVSATTEGRIRRQS